VNPVTVSPKCRFCHLVEVAEYWEVCSECHRRVDHPQVGDGCAVAIGSDVYPATILRVTSHTIVVRWDREHKGGLTTPGAGGREMGFVKNRHGRWVHRSYLLSLGSRMSYRDPSF
jgi:hypothetical protein